jgi:ribA/ribD-fused uncharacterized protein
MSKILAPAMQNEIALTEDQKEFSFLNRTFVFKRGKKHEPKIETTAEPEEKEKIKKIKLTKTDEPEPVLFHGADESKGEYRNFSNMSEHRIEIDGIMYPSVEHYFQAMKSKEFKDDEMYEKILKAKTTKAVKALGKKVKGFEKEIWDDKKDEIMFRGIKAKFVQHPALRKQLEETGDKMIGEADARNTYWGIGTSMASEKSKHPAKWRGQNRIGKMLMDLRKEFRED